MRYGTLYGIGVGPGDPELLTVKATKTLKACKYVFVPKNKVSADSISLEIARSYICSDAVIHELIFPMITDRDKLNEHWEDAAREVFGVLEKGKDACFLTLGDALLYSTYIYLVRALKRSFPGVEIKTIPGITAFSAAAALTEFPLGEAKNPIVIIPTADNLDGVKRALDMKATIVLMKIGKRLKQIIDLLDESGAIERSILVSRAGQPAQKIETDLRQLMDVSEIGYLSIILIQQPR